MDSDFRFRWKSNVFVVLCSRERGGDEKRDININTVVS